MSHFHFEFQGPRYVPSGGAGLLMSATLNPPAGAVARADSALRLHDYLAALRFYLSQPAATIDRILLVDNSASDLGPLIELVEQLAHDKRVELISFSGNDHDPRLGKAYGEFKLMDFGLAHSSLFKAQDIVWKTTGRLQILNLPRLSRRASRKNFDLLCDLHNVPYIGSRQWRDNRYMDLRLFAFRHGAWDTLFRESWRDLDIPFDAAFLYRRVLQRGAQLRVIPRFPVQPQFSGVSGRHLRDYNAPGQRLKNTVRDVQRRVFPWLWI